MEKASEFIKLIGNTPLIKLKKMSEITGCNIFGKAEFLNPGQSIKDRAALFMINEAIQKKKLKKGGIIVEGSAGNTGIGLTLIGNSLGFKSVIVIPNTQSQEKKDLLVNSGAKLIEVPAVPYSDENNYIKYAKKISEELDKSHKFGAYWINQFDNTINRLSHEKTTGPEIFNQTDGKIDAFICSIGSGGTISGVANFLRKKNKNIKIGVADPYGSSMYSYFKNGELKSEGNSITEGIGQGRITENLKNLKVDFTYRISDQEAIDIIYELLKYEGILVGTSAGINIVGALRLAKELGPGNTIVTVLCDHGMRYKEKIFNEKFLNKNKIIVKNFFNSDFQVPNLM